MAKDFKSQKRTRKGELGETYVHPVLRNKGYNVYTTSEDENMAHPIDCFITKMSKNSVIIKGVEIKTRPEMNYYTAQGLDNHKVIKYDELEKKMPLVIFFIDENKGTIHCADYTELKKPSNVLDPKQQKYIQYPNTNILAEQKITLYDATKLKFVGNITEEQKEALKALTKRNYEYEEQPKEHDNTRA